MTRLPRRTGPLLVGLVIAEVAGAAYVSSLDNFFWNDDYWWLNHTRKTASDPTLLFEDIIGCFRPVVNVYFAVTYPLFGVSPAGYRAVALAIHVVNALLLGTLARLLWGNRWSCYLAALILAVAWVHYEVVYWVSAASDLLSLSLLLSASLLYLRHLRTRGRAWYVLSLIAAAAALLSKESAVVLPALLLLLHLSQSRERLSCLLPFWVMALVLIALERAFGIFALHGTKFGPGTHMFSNLAVYGRHILLEPFGPWSWLRPIAATALLLPLVAMRKTRLVAALGAAWMAAALLPVTQWRYVDHIESRWCYVPTAGLAVWLAGWGTLLTGPSRLRRICALAVAAAFCAHNVLAIRGVEDLEHLRFAELQGRLIASMQSMLRPETRRVVVSRFPPIHDWQAEDISDLFFDGKLVKNDRFPIPEGSRVSSDEILVFTYAQERAVLR